MSKIRTEVQVHLQMSAPTPLTSSHIGRIQEALLAAYDLDGLQIMLRTQLDIDLEQIVAVRGRTLTEIIYDLIRYYAAQEAIPQLLAAARTGNPANQQLAAVADELVGVEFAPLPPLDSHAGNSAVFEQSGQQVVTQINVAGDLISPAPRTLPTLSIMLGIAALAGLLLAGVLLWQSSPMLMDWWKGPACAGIQLCAVVAEPAGAETNQAHDLAVEIAQQIRDMLGPDAQGQIKVAIAPSVEDGEEARRLAAADGALLAVWGRVLQEAGKLRVHFELNDTLGVGESHQVRTLRAEPLFYDPIAGGVVCANCFDIAAGEVGQRVAIVAHTAAGLLHYADQPSQAYADFMAALYCAGEEIEPKLLVILRPDCPTHVRPDDWSPALLQYYAGKAAVLSGSFETGIALLQAAAAENPYDPAAPLGIGAAYQEWIGTTQAPEAAEAFTEAVGRIESLLPDVQEDAVRASLYHDLGLIYELQEDWGAARDSYAKAVELFGGDKPIAYVSLVRLGHVLAQSGDVAGARARLEQAAALDKDAPWSYLELANLAWTEQQDRRAAERWLRQAEQVAPAAPYVHLQRAELCESWDDASCAEQAYQAALVSRPNSGWLRGRVGDFYRPAIPVRASQNWDKAAEQYEWAVEFRPQDPWAHERLAYVLLNQGRAIDALKHYDRAVALTFDDSAPARLYCSQTMAQERAGLDEEARASRSECERRNGGVPPESSVEEDPP